MGAGDATANAGEEPGAVVPEAGRRMVPIPTTSTVRRRSIRGTSGWIGAAGHGRQPLGHGRHRLGGGGVARIRTAKAMIHHLRGSRRNSAVRHLPASLPHGSLKGLREDRDPRTVTLCVYPG